MKPFAVALFLLFLSVPSFANSVTMYNYGYEIRQPANRFSILMVPGQEQLLYSQRPFPWGPTTSILFLECLILRFPACRGRSLLSIRGPLQLLFQPRAARQVAQTTALSSFRQMVATMALSSVR